MWRDVYVWEKLRELEGERPPVPRTPGQRQARLASGVARMTGRLRRRMGEGLESWAAPSQPEGHWEQDRYG
jgi:hypothetical protein